MQQSSVQHNKKKIPKFDENKARKLLTNKEKNQLKNVRYAGDGLIGSIKTYESGKKELVVGDFCLDLTETPLTSKTTFFKLDVKYNQEQIPQGTIHNFGDIHQRDSFTAQYKIEDLCD